MPENMNPDSNNRQVQKAEPRQNQANRQSGNKNYKGYHNKRGQSGSGENVARNLQQPKSGNSENKIQSNKGQNMKSAGQQPRQQQNRQDPQNRSANSSQNRGAHRGYNKSKNNRFEDKKINAIETVDDISMDILRIEKEIELEIKEIAAMTLGV